MIYKLTFIGGHKSLNQQTTHIEFENLPLFYKVLRGFDLTDNNPGQIFWYQLFPVGRFGNELIARFHKAEKVDPKDCFTARSLQGQLAPA